MATRRESRRLALEILYEADVRSESVDGIAERRSSSGAFPYARRLLAGIAEHSRRIDELIGTYSLGWSLERMPAIDRNILRLAVYELLFDADIPKAVAIDEAVELAKELSTADSGRFVNGVLSRVAEIAAEPKP